MPTIFALGPVEFFGTEIPEQLMGLGGREAIAVHEFPGGTRTIQTFGAFPTPIQWRGVLTGSLALERSIQIDRLRVSGTTTQLTFGPFAWLGIVQSFIPEPRHEWLVPYKVVFQPEQDLSGAQTPPSASSAAEAAWNQQLNSLAALQQGALLPLPGILASPVGVLLIAATLAISTAAGGKVSGIAVASATAVLGAVTGVQLAASPLLLSTDATLSSPAEDVYVAAGVLGTLVTAGATQAKWSFTAINPNLFMLAAQYLGDASRWREIALLSGVSAPIPQGIFTMMIPAP